MVQLRTLFFWDTELHHWIFVAFWDHAVASSSSINGSTDHWPLTMRSLVSKQCATNTHDRAQYLRRKVFSKLLIMISYLLLVRHFRIVVKSTYSSHHVCLFICLQSHSADTRLIPVKFDTVDFLWKSVTKIQIWLKYIKESCSLHKDLKCSWCWQQYNIFCGLTTMFAFPRQLSTVLHCWQQHTAQQYEGNTWLHFHGNASIIFYGWQVTWTCQNVMLYSAYLVLRLLTQIQCFWGYTINLYQSNPMDHWPWKITLTPSYITDSLSTKCCFNGL